MTEPQKNTKKQPRLLAPADLKPVYSNLARIAHSPADFVLDFAHLLPGETQADIMARILLSPLSAKLLYQALGNNLAQYEAAYGEIAIPRASLADQLFRRYQGPDLPGKNEGQPDDG